jgi:hypothetical protein
MGQRSYFCFFSCLNSPGDSDGPWEPLPKELAGMNKQDQPGSAPSSGAGKGVLVPTVKPRTRVCGGVGRVPGSAAKKNLAPVSPSDSPQSPRVLQIQASSFQLWACYELKVWSC